MRTKPKMSKNRMCGAEFGFLEIPSQALLIALAWPKIPAAAARAMTAPPMIKDNLNREALLSDRPASWAKRGALITTKKKKSKVNGFKFFGIFFSFSFNVLPPELLHLIDKCMSVTQKQKPV